MNKSKLVLIVLGLSVIFFSGCSMKNDFNVVLEDNYKVKQDFDYKLSKVNVQIASESNKTGDLDIFTTTFPKSFKNSLIKTLNETKIFKGNSNYIDIKVLVLKKDAPNFGFTMMVDVDVQYTIKDDAGKVIYSNIITSKGVATTSEAFAGLERVNIANNRAVQNNIKLFINDVQIQLDKGK